MDRHLFSPAASVNGFQLSNENGDAGRAYTPATTKGTPTRTMPAATSLHHGVDSARSSTFPSLFALCLILNILTHSSCLDFITTNGGSSSNLEPLHYYFCLMFESALQHHEAPPNSMQSNVPSILPGSWRVLRERKPTCVKPRVHGYFSITQGKAAREQRCHPYTAVAVAVSSPPPLVTASVPAYQLQ